MVELDSRDSAASTVDITNHSDSVDNVQILGTGRSGAGSGFTEGADDLS